MSSPTPSVARMAHYVSHGSPVREDGTQEYRSECRAAIITEVADPSGVVGLSVHNPTGQFFPRGVEHDAGEEDWLADGGPVLCGGRVYGPGTWHWPART